MNKLFEESRYYYLSSKSVSDSAVGIDFHGIGYNLSIKLWDYNDQYEKGEKGRDGKGNIAFFDHLQWRMEYVDDVHFYLISKNSGNVMAMKDFEIKEGQQIITFDRSSSKINSSNKQMLLWSIAEQTPHEIGLGTGPTGTSEGGLSGGEFPEVIILSMARDKNENTYCLSSNGLKKSLVLQRYKDNPDTTHSAEIAFNHIWITEKVTERKAMADIGHSGLATDNTIGPAEISITLVQGALGELPMGGSLISSVLDIGVGIFGGGQEDPMAEFFKAMVMQFKEITRKELDIHDATTEMANVSTVTNHYSEWLLNNTPLSIDDDQEKEKIINKLDGYRGDKDNYDGLEFSIGRMKTYGNGALIFYMYAVSIWINIVQTEFEVETDPDTKVNSIKKGSLQKRIEFLKDAIEHVVNTTQDEKSNRESLIKKIEFDQGFLVKDDLKDIPSKGLLLTDLTGVDTYKKEILNYAFQADFGYPDETKNLWNKVVDEWSALQGDLFPNHPDNS
jgi:hypothetical protein